MTPPGSNRDFLTLAERDRLWRLFRAARAWVRSKQSDEDFEADESLELDLFDAAIDCMEDYGG